MNIHLKRLGMGLAVFAVVGGVCAGLGWAAWLAVGNPLAGAVAMLVLAAYAIGLGLDEPKE